MLRYLTPMTLIAALTATFAATRADHITVRLGNAEIELEGKVNDANRIMTVTHEKFRDLKLNLYYRDTREPIYIQEIIKVPTRREQYNRALLKAQKGSTAERLDLAHWTAKRGMLTEFYASIDLVLQADPNNEHAKRILALRDKLNEPLAPSNEEETLTKSIGSGFKFKRSKHYILAYDTPEDRAKERVDLLERVYETFFMFFAMKGMVLEKPKELMMVVLFNEHKNYLDYSVRQDPELKSAAGYWSPEDNIAVFFAQGTYPAWATLNEVSAQLDKMREDAERQKLRNRGDIVRLSDTIKLLKLVQQENEDVEVVTHEATHQVAGNSGLFPRRIRIPRWAQEGLAAFFEAPSGAMWAGVGATNATRLEWYRGLEKDRVHSDIDFIVSDHIYDMAASHASVLHAYGQAWALTHFLMDDKQFPKLMQYYRNLARLPADMVIGEDILKQCWDAAFGADRQAVDQDWRRHMNSLKTDIERLREQYGEKDKTGG